MQCLLSAGVGRLDNENHLLQSPCWRRHAKDVTTSYEGTVPLPVIVHQGPRDTPLNVHLYSMILLYNNQRFKDRGVKSIENKNITFI